MSVFAILFSQWTILIGVIIYFIYRWSITDFDYFEKKGILFQRPVPFFGNFGGLLFGTKNFHEIILSPYNEFKHKR